MSGTCVNCSAAVAHPAEYLCAGCLRVESVVLEYGRPALYVVMAGYFRADPPADPLDWVGTPEWVLDDRLEAQSLVDWHNEHSDCHWWLSVVCNEETDR